MTKKIDNTHLVQPKPVTGAELMQLEALTEVIEYEKNMRIILDGIELLIGDDIIIEVDAAIDNLKNNIAELKIKSDFSILLNEMKQIPDDVSQTELLEKIDKDAIREWREAQGFFSIRVQTLEQRLLLEEFLTSKCFPYYADQTDNCF